MTLPDTNTDLAASVLGDGPPLLILHGLFGSQRNWGGIIRQLAQHNRVHGLDLRNHGESPWRASMGYDEMAAEGEEPPEHPRSHDQDGRPTQQ